MSQWRKQNNGFLPKEEVKPAPGPETKAAEKLREIAQVGNGVQIHPDIINGQPGLRIKIGFE